MAPKCLPSELLFESVLFVHVEHAVPKVFSSCWLLQNLLLPRVIKWREKRRKMDAAIWSAQLGITHPEDGRPLTLAEAAQIRLYNREQKQFRNFRTGERLSLAESEKFCSPFVQRRLIQLGVLTLPPMALEQALNSGLLHPISGMFFHGKYLQFPLEEALGRGFIRLPPTQPLLALTLTDCIVQRFINGDSGKFEGNHKNERFTLFDALSVHKPPLINGKVRECINTATGRRLTVEEAIAEGVLNLNTGTFTDMAQQNEMSLNDAHLLGLIQKPRTLTELLEDEAFDKQLGVFMERGGLITLLEAISSGLLDANVWHIKTGQSDEVIAIGDALARGVLKPEGKIAVELVEEGGSHGGHLLELHEAHERGYLTHRTRHTIFDVKIVKNTEQGKLMSFNEAIENGTIQLQNEQFLYRTGHQTMPFSDALAQKLINPNFAAIFVGRLGIIEEGKEISLLDAVARGIVDAPNGVFIHPKNKSKITVREAYDLGQFLSLFDAIRIAALCDINSLMINSDGE